MNHWKVNLHQGILELRLDLPDTDINIFTNQGLQELDGILDEIPSREGVKAVIFTSAKKRIFVAGADIKEINQINSKEMAFALAEQGKKILAKIENLKVPTLTVINGVCLGGGYELALACSHRVACGSENVKIGLPEVNLGILPGFGGSIRLPRLIGIVKALPLILAGSVVSAKRALKLGLIDAVFEESSLLEKSIAYVSKISANYKNKPRRHPWTFLERLFLGPLFVYPAARKMVLKKSKGFYPAPMKIIGLVEDTYGRDDRSGFEKESRAFSDLAVTDVSKNLIHLFFLSEKYKKHSWTAVKDAGGKIERCGIIGAGVMGGGIAQLVSNRNVPVILKDISEKAIQAAKDEAARIYQSAVKRGKIRAEDVEKKMELISVDSGGSIAQADFVIEAVIEDMKIKQKVFEELSAQTKPETVLASNTSSLSLSKIGAGAKNPERVIGLHFFNPAYRMPLVEIILSDKTSDQTLEKTVRFARTLGKTVIVVKDSAGFLINRLLMPYLNEAAFLLEEGLSVTQIDRTAKLFGMPMGPLELVDQVGIDVAHKVSHVLFDAFGDRMKVSPLMESVKSRGLLGKKAGKGFYVYRGKNKESNSEFNTKAAKGRVENADIVKRLIYTMINEAARCLEEKIVDSAPTVDLGMIMGTGFPPFRGGLLRFADNVGLASIREDLIRFGKQTGSQRFEPCSYLTELASSGRKFYTA